MSRRDRQQAELRDLCRCGFVSRAVDLAFAHFAEFGRDDEVLALLGDAVARASVTSAVRRRFSDLKEQT